MIPLPRGWASVRLGEAIELKYGKGLPDRERSGKGYPVYGSNGIVGSHTTALTGGPTVVIGRKGSVGEVNYSEGPCSPIDTTYFIDVFPAGQSRFWFHKLRSLNLGSLNKSTAIPGFNRTDAYAVDIELPPSAEQKRIANKLDTVLARVDACRERLDSVGPLLKRFRQSVLAAATSGTLTEDWRAQGSAQGHDVSKELAVWQSLRAKTERKTPAAPDLTRWNQEVPQGWAVASVHQFAECLDRLRVPIKRENRQNAKGLYPYYGANGEVGRIDEYIFDDELVLVTEDETFYGREKPIAYRVSGRCWVNNHAHVLRASSPAANDYLCYALMYYNVIPWLSGTTGRAKLTQQALNSLPLAVPPAIELIEITRRVKALLAFADRLEARLAQAQIAADRLTPALLAKAFRGELAPQDPNDEPASELLKRLHAARADAAKGAPIRRVRAKATPIGKKGSQADEVVKERAMER